MAKRRVTLTGAEYDHYHMVVQGDGTFVLEPRVLEMIDGSVDNFRKGLAGRPIDFSEYQELLAEDDE